MATWQDRFYQKMSESKFATIHELCQAAGIASSTFGNALKGSHIPKPATMEKVATVLGTTWQYLMNGDEKQITPDTQIPVLMQDQVMPWIDGKLSLEDCEDVIHSPFPIRSGYFAWKVDVDDMEPEFTRNSYIVFDTDVNYQVSHWHHRMFILVGWMIDRDLEQLVRSELFKMPFPAFDCLKGSDHSRSVKFSDMTVCELCRTMQGYQLMSADRHFACAMDPKRHQILAQARYGITLY